jgi:hypothetical protein
MAVGFDAAISRGMRHGFSSRWDVRPAFGLDTEAPENNFSICGSPSVFRDALAPKPQLN